MVEYNGPVGLPIIDISSFVDRPGHTDEQRQELATLWDETMTNKGFAIVVGHGVTEDLVMRLRNASEKFFNLPQEEKEKF
jgi:isopenicillin N synthase-like dioxygenase